MVDFNHVSLPLRRDEISPRAYDAKGKYLFWITLAAESNALDELREKGESWLDFRTRMQPTRDAMAAEELEIADFIVNAANAFDILTAQNEWLKGLLSDLQLPANSQKNIEEWLVECGMPSLSHSKQGG